MTAVQPTSRWRGIAAVALFAGTVGLVAKRPDVLLVAVVGVVYAVYPRLTGPSAVELSVDRRLSDDHPTHQEPVEVTVTVENTGPQFLPDVRIVDGVPPMLSVIDGTARHAAALRPGDTTSFSYTVEAIHGSHDFEPATAIVRDVSGANERKVEVSADHAIECQSLVPAVPVRQRTRRHSFGQIVTDEGGSGIEFHQTRAYRHGDSMSRIDWRRYARTGELTTIEFREERTSSIVMCLDARPPAYCSAADDEPHGVAYELSAAEQLLSAFLDERLYVGLAAIGREFYWLAPDTGAGHAQDTRNVLASHPTLSVYPPNGDHPSAAMASQQVVELRKHLGREDQVLLVSPLTDGFMAETAVELQEWGHAVTVVSPDITTDDTIGGRLVRLERRDRIRTLRDSNVDVIDWDTDTPLGTALVRAEEVKAA